MADNRRGDKPPGSKPPDNRPPDNKPPGNKPPDNTVSELKELLVAYAKQETVDPLKSLGRYLGFGLAGSLLMSIASVFLVLAVLRVLQNETGSTFTGNLSWIPYLLTLAVVAAFLAVIGLAIKRVKDAQRPRVPRSIES